MVLRKTAAAIERTIAEREATADTLDREITADRPALSDLMDDAKAYERAFNAIRAKESRLVAIRCSLAPLEADLSFAREVEARDDLLKRRAAMDRTLTALAKEWAKLGPHLTAVAEFGARFERTREEADELNVELRTVGQRRKVLNGITYSDRAAGFEAVGFPTSANITAPARFFKGLRIPAFHTGTHPLWSGLKEVVR